MIENSLTLRDATPADAPAIAALHCESWRSAYRGILPDGLLDGPLDLERAAHWRRMLAAAGPEDFVLLAETADGLAGFIAVWSEGEPGLGALIDNFHVRPSLKGQGIGTQLLGAAVERLVAAGQRAAHLWVFDANAPTLAFYKEFGGVVEKRGFDRIEERDIPHSCVVWRDLPALAARCRGKR